MLDQSMVVRVRHAGSPSYSDLHTSLFGDHTPKRDLPDPLHPGNPRE